MTTTATIAVASALESDTSSRTACGSKRVLPSIWKQAKDAVRESERRFSWRYARHNSELSCSTNESPQGTLRRRIRRQPQTGNYHVRESAATVDAGGDDSGFEHGLH